MTYESTEEIIDQIRTVLKEWNVVLRSHRILPHKAMQCPSCEAGMYGDMKEKCHYVEHGPLCDYTKIARIIGESNIQRIE